MKKKDKRYNFYRLLTIYIMTCISMNVFILNFKIFDNNYNEIKNNVHRFYLLISSSTKAYDVTLIILFIFIYYFFHKHYFLDDKNNKIKIKSNIISFVISIFIIFGLSIYNYHNLSIITSSPIQVFKCIILLLGYYFIINAFIKSILLKKTKNILSNKINIILSIVSLHIFILYLSEVDLQGNIINNNFIYLFFYQYNLSLININLNIILLLIIINYFYNNTLFKNNKINKQSILLSLLLVLITLIGKSYTEGDSLKILFSSAVQIYKTIILTIGYLIVYYAFIEKIKQLEIEKIYKRKTKYEKIWNKHPIIVTILCILIFWLPYLIVFYPGGSTGDTADSIFQFFNIKNSWSANSINLINPNVYINKHHSVLFTVLLGIFIKFGLTFNNFDLGYYLFIIFQVIILICIFSYTLYYFKKIKIKYWIIYISLLYYCLSATIIQYSMTAVKDTLSAGFNLLYVLFLYQIINEYNTFFKNKKKVIALIIVMLLTMMLRNNGIYTILFSFPFLVIIDKINKRKVLEILTLVLLLFITYNDILLPSYGVSNGSIREVLSVPIMQLARTAKYHKNSFSKEDITKIDKVLNFESMIYNYNPNISDAVKNLYKKDSTKKDNINLFKIWLKYLKKYPFTYLDSFLNSSYQYIYPVFNDENLDVSRHYFLEGEFNTHNIFEPQKETFNSILLLKNYSLFTIYFNNVAIIDILLILLSLFILKTKEYKYIIPLLPLLSITLINLFSPVNGCQRYILPVFFSLPIILITYYSNKKYMEK